MYFFVDENKKIVFGWNPKCGSNHIRKLFWFLTGQQLHVLQILSGKMPENSKEYKLILIMRNPYERIVSGFVFLYKKYGYCGPSWNTSDKKLTFKNFVDELAENGTTTSMIDKYHFDPQVLETDNIPFKIGIDKLYDLSNIDYDYIETLYDKKIPNDIRNFRGRLVNTQKVTKLGLKDHLKLSDTDNEKKVYDLEINEYENIPNLKLTQFYNQDIADKVTAFYKSDIDFINKYLVE